MTSRAAIEDLAKKIRLERKLNIEMRRILNKYAVALGRSLRVRGTVPNARALTGQRTLIVLEDQYERTAKVFKKDFRKEVEKSNPYIFEYKTIEDDIDDNLASFIATRSVTRSAVITTTTQADSQAAVLRATIELLDAEIALTNEAVASRTVSIFKRGINGRANTIAITETQNAAEGTKAIEVETVRRSPDVPGVETVLKTWNVIEDGKERDTHREADGQEVDSTGSFTVGSSSLLYPGDDSLGAELKEIINCRCSTTFENIGIQ